MYVNPDKERFCCRQKYPRSLQVRRDGTRTWSVWDGVNIVKRFGKDRAQADAYVAEYEHVLDMWALFLYPKASAPVTAEHMEIRSVMNMWSFLKAAGR